MTKKGSKAGSILREKADQLEEALSETKGQYTLDMMPDWMCSKSGYGCGIPLKVLVYSTQISVWLEGI